MNEVEIWKTAELTKTFLENIRGAIPLANEQIYFLLKIIQQASPQVTNFLDLGCGDGILGRSILSQYPDSQGVFLDFSQPMLEAAKNKIGEKASQATFILQDFGETAWLQSVQKKAPFDVIVSGFAIHHYPDETKQKIYQQIFELLKPGGIFLNLEHVASATAWVEKISDETFIDSLYAFHQTQGNKKSRDELAKEYYHRPDKAANILSSVEIQCHWLRNLGFRDVDCFLKVFEIALFGGKRPPANL
ncbi:class I SAM-dependent methyltransferase [Ancylothrix sp. C2]|uniref:class I SAM-dependent methyltransferase n=1 Tax=Ancylothrix sp. D3o TaxID=2953691 RepID=UPI0021BA5C05|nr:class I SAM-dependent methyltransferase [Ancylothrix sp. D3o]MCT7950866.1 class I SAM-dependent methyltransferase [Ancylothrix sp. D3o]